MCIPVMWDFIEMKIILFITVICFNSTLEASYREVSHPAHCAQANSVSETVSGLHAVYIMQKFKLRCMSLRP